MMGKLLCFFGIHDKYPATCHWHCYRCDWHKAR